MLLLPETLTADEAQDALRMLAQGLRAEPQDGAVVDASALRQFDSSALAVLLECHRQAQASGKPFTVRQPPQALEALAKLYGVHALLLGSAGSAAAS